MAMSTAAARSPITRILLKPYEAFKANNLRYNPHHILKPIFIPTSLPLEGQADFGDVEIIDEYENENIKAIPRVIVKPGRQINLSDPERFKSKFVAFVVPKYSIEYVFSLLITVNRRKLSLRMLSRIHQLYDLLC